MNQSNLQIIAARVRGLGKELFAIANQLEAQAPHLGVNLPRDLFSDLEQQQPQLFEGIKDEPLDDKIKRASASWKGVDVDKFMDDIRGREPETQRRTYRKNPRPMQEHLAVTSAERVGKAQGFCARNDIERSVARLTGRSREDVRVAVNRVAARMRLTCVKSNSYRYYPRAQRREIVDAAIAELERI